MQNDAVMKSVAAAIEKEGISAFRFDFSGNGLICFSLFPPSSLIGHFGFWFDFLGDAFHCCRESEGSFYFGNYNHEADDLRSVIQHFSNMNRVVPVILGHSKGK